VASKTGRRPGIGRGLAAILPESDASGAGELRELPVELIKPNPEQPRTNFDPAALSALAASIEASGVVQPLLVRPLVDGSYELVAGERRWRAAQQAGLEKVPAVVRDQAESERLQAALIENMVREDLNPVEEAKACAALVEDLKLTKEDLARRVGRNRSTISNLIRLLELPDEALEMLEKTLSSESPLDMPFCDLAIRMTDLSEVRGAYDIRVADPDEAASLPDADDCADGSDG